jgi:hypothetical protein
MKFTPYRYWKPIVPGVAVIAAIAAVSTYFVTSSPVQAPATAKTTAGTGAVQFVTGSAVSSDFTAGPKSSSTPSIKPKSSTTPTVRSGSSTAPSASLGVSADFSTDPSPNTNSRSPYTWPFSWDSIWNMPIASTAAYAPAGITSNGSYENSGAADFDSINPTFPVVTLRDARLGSGDIGAVSVYGDPGMAANGELNTCSAFLGTDNVSVYQGQTTELTAGGNPSFGGVVDDASLPVNIKSKGITGCHGGSGLSGLGGTLSLSDLTQPGPITHALKVALDGYINYSKANGGFRWPAVNSDDGYNSPSSGNYYGGSNPNVQAGSLLALPRSINPSSFSNPTVVKIARAMQDYGVYVVDTTATGIYNYSTLITNYNTSSHFVSGLCVRVTPCGSPSSNSDIFSSQLDALFQDLEVVTNNTASTPGGGVIGASRCAPYAPQFTDGSDAPPSVAVIDC